MNPFSQSRMISDARSFTLVELLVVIGILAILTAAVVILLNPAELLKQSRDSKRTTDLASLNNAIKLLLTQNPDVNLGAASTVYVSLADSSSTCGSYVLPALPSGWQYRCATSANYQKTDGSGWVPVSFGTTGNVASLPVLPLDPQNSGAYYYSYIPGGSWEITSLFESKKYASRAQSDAGIDPERLEVGSNLALWKDAYGLVGRWSLSQADEKLGPELIVNGGFDSDTAWSKGAGWTIGGGTANFSATGSYGNMTQNIGSVGKNYKITLNATRTAGALYVKVGANGTFGTVGATGSYSFYSNAITDGYFYLQADPSFVGTVDNVSVREVQAGDSSLSGNDAAAYGLSYASNQRGEANAALSFNGSSDYVDMGSLTAQISNGTWTISFWMKPSSVANYRNPFDANFLAAGNNVGPRFEQYSDGSFKMIIGTSLGSFSSLQCYNAAIAPNRWYHVLATRDSAGVLKAYVNGAQTLSTTSYSWQPVFGSVNVGRGYANSSERWFSGSVTDVRIYNRALSDAEIQAIYNATK
jgi:type II secretory pathway pseudopilin PulG